MHLGIRILHYYTTEEMKIINMNAQRSSYESLMLAEAFHNLLNPIL